MKLILLSLNINGARDFTKTKMEICEFMKQNKLDVVTLKETHSDLNNASVCAKRMGWFFIFKS